MYQLYGKAFAAKAVDLNKKDLNELKDGKLKNGDYKFVARGSASGTSYEVNAAQKSGGLDAKFTVPFNDFKISVKSSNDTTTPLEVGVDYKASNAMSGNLTIKNPSLEAKSAAASGTVTLLDPEYSAEIKFGLFDGPAAAKFSADGKTGNANMNNGSIGASAAIAFPFPATIPGLENWKTTVGVSPAVGFKNDGSMNLNMPISFGMADSTMQLAFVSGVTNSSGSFTASNFGLRAFVQQNADVAFAVELDKSDYEFDKYDIFKGAKAKSSTTATVGMQAKLNGSAVGKAKLTYDIDGSKPTVDFSVKSGLGGGSAVVGVTLGEKAPLVSFTYNL